MAYYKLYKWFSVFRKKHFTNWIYWYSEYVLKTPEQRELERQQKERDVATAMTKLIVTKTMINGLGRY